VQNAKNKKLHLHNAKNIKTACAECQNIKLHVQNAKKVKNACAEC
jgi:PHP family Zn ribbon phosphoesterase